MIYFPTNPTLGQRYVAINGVTYTWMGTHWNSALALQQGTAEYYVDGGDADFEYIELRDGILDGGTA
jgi:hypothetical protein